jgi:drug/metabolite transporter (DMT)-like permease
LSAARNLQAAAFSLGATCIFVLIFSSGRFTQDTASPLQLMFLRYAGGFITVSLIARSKGQTFMSMQSKHRGKQALRALCGGFGGAALIFGNTQIPIVDANAIGLLSAVFVVVLGALFLAERLRRGQMLGALICLAGAMTIMAMRGAFTDFRPSYLVPIAVLVVGAALVAAEAIWIKVLTRTDRPLVTLAHANLFGATLLALPAALTWQSGGLLNLALLAILGPTAILGQYFNIRAFSLADASLLAPLGYASLPFAALVGLIAFGEVPSLGVLLGAGLIAIGGTVLVMSRR